MCLCVCVCVSVFVFVCECECDCRHVCEHVFWSASDFVSMYLRTRILIVFVSTLCDFNFGEGCAILEALE